jgi:ribosomal protein S12 methylthiotransferase accessory factor
LIRHRATFWLSRSDDDEESLHTSTRVVSPRITLRHAKVLAEMAGVHAVHDITAMDCLGVPVFISERPGAACTAYTFGKGCFPIDSEVGAYMEAIETWFSEPGVARIETRWGSPSKLSGVRADCDPILEFAPKFDYRAAPDRTLLLARAEDVESGAAGWIPAELVFNPAPPDVDTLYGSSSNGLASGNTVLEASIHALYELIERDIWSIEFVRSRSAKVFDEGLPFHVRKIVEAAVRNGLRLVIRTVPNDYGIPFFAAFLFDPSKFDSRFFNGGWGCHHERGTALMRAVTEAAQSRAAVLHGGRELKRSDDPDADAERVEQQIETVSNAAQSIQFEDIPEQPPAPSLAAQWAAAVNCLRRVVDRPIYRVIYTPSEGPLHVVRLVVPLLEHFTRSTMRIGPRMRAELEARTGESGDCV